jgi:hypothetical protein
MAYYDNPRQVNDEAINIAGGKTFQVIQLADSSGSIVDPAQGTVVSRTPTTTSVASSSSSVTIISANANRRGISIANDSTQILRLSFNSPATTSNAFIVMQPGSFLLLDQQLIVGNAIYGIWVSANGTAQVTEYV